MAHPARLPMTQARGLQQVMGFLKGVKRTPLDLYTARHDSFLDASPGALVVGGAGVDPDELRFARSAYPPARAINGPRHLLVEPVAERRDPVSGSRGRLHREPALLGRPTRHRQAGGLERAARPPGMERRGHHDDLVPALLSREAGDGDRFGARVPDRTRQVQSDCWNESPPEADLIGVRADHLVAVRLGEAG